MRGLRRAAADRVRQNLDEMRAGLRALRTEEDPPHPASPFLSAVLRVARSTGIAIVAGFLAGALALGLGGRLAMRISGILAGPTAAGLLTANQNVVGEITLDGTLGLMLSGGIVGALCGPMYVAVRPLLAPLGRWQPFAFGVLFVLAFGSSCITPQNADFRRFGPPIVNVTLFALIFVVFGMVLASLTSAMDPAGRSTGPPTRPTRLKILITGLLALPALAATWQTVVSIARILTGR